jgi:antitoxin HicB
MEYPVIFEAAEEGGFVVHIPDFGCVTQGDTEAEAEDMAADAICTMAREYMRMGREVPLPGKVRGRKYWMVRLPALQETKIELYRAFRASGMRKSEFARRLGIPKTIVDRLFDLDHHSRLDQVEAAFKVLGKELHVTVRDAA